MPYTRKIESTLVILKSEFLRALTSYGKFMQAAAEEPGCVEAGHVREPLAGCFVFAIDEFIF